jgi:hypothetical protein
MMSKRKYPKTSAQIEKEWKTQKEKDRAQFVSYLDQASDLEVFETYVEVSQADDWDGMFTEMQRWKAETTANVMRQRLTLSDKQERSERLC